jgi:hypothetical protein
MYRCNCKRTESIYFIFVFQFHIGNGHCHKARYQRLTLVTGVVDARYLYLIIGNGPYGNARYKGQLLVMGKMPVTNDGLFVTFDW